MARASPVGEDFAWRCHGRRSGNGVGRDVAIASQAPPRRRSADAFRGAFGLVSADRVRSGGGAQAFDPCARAVWTRQASEHRWWKSAAGAGIALAGAAAGAGDARPSRILAWKLRRGESGNERPLSQTSVAGQSVKRTGHTPRKASWNWLN